MFRLTLNLRNALLITLLFTALFILGCAPTQSIPDANSERWIGKISGMAKGDLELFLNQTEGQGDLYSVAGRFMMNLGTTSGGYGSVKTRGRLKGKIENGAMRTKISGNVEVEGALYQISGEMTGTVSKTKASGTWKIKHIEGLHSGKWTAVKAEK